MSEDLVQATSEDDLSQNGQLHSVPTKKTLGQVGRDASGLHTSISGYVTEEGWEAAAQAIRDAVIEECADLTSGWVKTFVDLLEGEDYLPDRLQIEYGAQADTLNDLIRAFRSLKASPQRSGDRSASPSDGDQREPS